MTSIPEISIITPVIRPENLLAIWNSITIEDFEWLIVCDTLDLPNFLDGTSYVRDSRIKYIQHSSEACALGISGNPQRNKGLDMATGKFVYFLDDDNIVHPEYFQTILPIIQNNTVAVVVSQIVPSGQRRLDAAPSKVKPCHVDTAQFIIPREFIGSTRWDIHDYCADGVFFPAIFAEYSESFLFIDRDLSYYNYLRP